jgi:hypothetical protein
MQSFVQFLQTVHNKVTTAWQQQNNNGTTRVWKFETERKYITQIHMFCDYDRCITGYMTGNWKLTLKQRCTNHCWFFHKKNKEKLKACSVCSTTTRCNGMCSLLQFVSSNSKRHLIVLYWFPSSFFSLSVHRRTESLLMNMYLPTTRIFAAQWLATLLHIQEDPRSNLSPKNSCFS